MTTVAFIITSGPRRLHMYGALMKIVDCTALFVFHDDPRDIDAALLPSPSITPPCTMETKQVGRLHWDKTSKLKNPALKQASGYSFSPLVGVTPSTTHFPFSFPLAHNCAHQWRDIHGHFFETAVERSPLEMRFLRSGLQQSALEASQ